TIIYPEEGQLGEEDPRQEEPLEVVLQWAGVALWPEEVLLHVAPLHLPGELVHQRLHPAMIPMEPSKAILVPVTALLAMRTLMKIATDKMDLIMIMDKLGVPLLVTIHTKVEAMVTTVNTVTTGELLLPVVQAQEKLPLLQPVALPVETRELTRILVLGRPRVDTEKPDLVC
ncbi:hypothetical protein EGW08_000973, partial [Elysia chlorotica]